MTNDATRPCGHAIAFREPRTEDGPAVSELIAACPPLDPNSAYCNLLQCTHFAHDCVVAERDGRIEGWLSGYRLPDDATRYFLWQVAVAPSARGEGLAGRLIDALLARPAMQGVRRLLTTITRDNAASWALFRSFARQREAEMTDSLFFDRDIHFSRRHASEWLVEIGPFDAGVARLNQTKTDRRKLMTGGTRS